MAHLSSRDSLDFGVAMFVTYTPEEITELLIAGSKNKKAVPASQEEKLFHSIKHVRLFDEIEMSDTLSIISNIKINRYKEGDILELGAETKDRIFYIISGSLYMPISEDNHIELGKDQVFGEVNAFTKTITPKSLSIVEENTMIFSFRINHAALSKDNATSFVKFYEALMVYTTNKLSWFELA